MKPLLAIAYLYLGRSEDSKEALKRALELRPAHVADTLVVQARFYMMAGRYAESEYLFTQAHELLEGHRGPDDPGMAGSLADFAILYEMQGKTAQSDPLFERAFRLDASATTERLKVWGEGALRRKQYGQADRLLARAIPLLERRPQPEDLVLVTGLEERAEALRKSGRKAEAVAPASRAEAIRKKLGPCGLVGMRQVALGDIQAAEAAGRIESWKRRSYEEMDHNRDGKICVD